MRGDDGVRPTDVGTWDSSLTKHVVDLLRPIVKIYHRSEVRGLQHVPPGRCLLVGNHSGGLTPTSRWWTPGSAGRCRPR